MYRQLCLALAIAVSAPMCVGAQELEGNYNFSYVANGFSEQTLVIVGFKDKAGEIVATRVQGAKFKSVTQDGAMLRVTIEGSGIEFVFEGVLPKGATKVIQGTVTFNETAYL